MEFRDDHREYISNNKVVLKTIPSNYVVPDLKNVQLDLIFETPESLYNYIIEEKAFWEQYKERANLINIIMLILMRKII